AGGAGIDRAAAFDYGIGHVADRRRRGVYQSDRLHAGHEVAAIIGRLPGAGDDPGFAAARRKGVGVADGHVAAGVATGGRTLSGGRGVAGTLHGGVGRAGDRRLGGIDDRDGLVAGREIAAIIGRLPGAGDDTSVAAARRKGVGVADDHIAAG